MLNSKKEFQDKPKPKGIPIPAGTEQETGLTRAQTELPEEIKTKKKQSKVGFRKKF